MKKHLLQLLGGLTMLAAASVSNAATINGSVEITGMLSTVGTLPSATGVTFGGAGVLPWSVDSATGDLAPMFGASTALGDLAITDFSFDAPSGTTIWSFSRLANNFQFSSDKIINSQTDDFLSITIYGTLSSTNSGFDDTSAIFRLSTQFNTGQITASFSSGTSAVPIPAAGWLFGSALIGAASIARRKTQRKGMEGKSA